MKFWVTEKKTLSNVNSDEWLDRLEGMDTVEILVYAGPRVKVDSTDEIALRMAVGDTCSIERAT